MENLTSYFNLIQLRTDFQSWELKCQRQEKKCYPHSYCAWGWRWLMKDWVCVCVCYPRITDKFLKLETWKLQNAWTTRKWGLIEDFSSLGWLWNILEMCTKLKVNYSTGSSAWCYVMTREVGWGSGSELKREGIYVYILIIMHTF